MDILTETKSTAARFIAEHETMQEDLANARLRIEDQRKEIERLDATLSIQKDALAAANTDKNTYLQYAFELSAQLQFIVAGSARALMIAYDVRNKIAVQASNIPPVPGPDIKELESIIGRIGEANAKANDGNGLSDDEWHKANGAEDAPKPLTGEQMKAMAGNGGLPPPLPGFLVDRDGLPVQPSAATKSMMVA